MTNQIEPQIDQDAAPDDSWMPDIKPVQPAKPKPKPKVTPLRPLDQLAADLENPPLAGAAHPDVTPAGAGLDPPDAAPPPPPPAGGRGRADRPDGQIWDGCPVKPLGVNGATSYFLDVNGQLRGVGKLERMTVMALFGHMLPRLCWHFPKWVKDEDSGAMKRKPDQFDGDGAAMVMYRAVSEKGLFDPENAVRGVGAWVDDDGTLIYHCGDRLLIGADTREPDTHQGRIYPAFPPIPHPAQPGKFTDPVPPLLEMLSTWQWDRPDIDAMVTLGLIGVQAFGGALDWRPAYWITGGAGSGKSALQRLMLHLHGGEKGLVQSTDPTARGIASLLGQSTLPVALDELEPGDSGSTKERDIIVTARVAASGGRWVRGSSDQKGSTGQLRSTFLFSSVLVPGILKSQDLQRIIMLNLGPLPEGAKQPDLRAETWRKRGAALKRLIIDRWPTWGQRLDLWRVAFAAQGIQGRDADNWATTLAMAQMMQDEALPTAEAMAGWTAKVAPAIRAAEGEAMNDADEVVMHLLSQPYDVLRRGEQFTVAQWLMVAAGSPGAPDNLLSDFTTDEYGRAARMKQANAKLAKALIKVVSDHDQEPRIFIGSAKARPLLDLFFGSQWAGGAWKQSLERIKGARPSSTSRTLAGIPTRGVEIPISALPGLGMFPQDREQPTPVISADAMEDFY